MHTLCSKFASKKVVRKSGGGNFYRLSHYINCLENPIVICILYVVNLLQKKWYESRGGNFYRLSHNINYLENPIVICILYVVNLLQKKWYESWGGELL